MKQIKICTRTGIHTCRLGSLHLNERDKSVLEEYIITLTTKHEEELKKAVEADREMIKDFLWSKAHHGKTADGEIYETIVHWCYVKQALSPTKTDKQ